MAKLTIVTIVLNDVAHIEKTILSVLNQTFTDIEYWIIDGGSSDGTMDIVRKYSDRLKFISEPDKGLYDAMNKGIDRATGEYIMFLNSGDQLYANDTLEQVFYTATSADVYYGDTLIIDEQGNARGLRRLRPPQQLTWKDLRRGMLVSHQAFIVRRAICPHYDLRYHFSADFDWMIRVLKQAKLIVNTRQIIVKYLMGGITEKNLHKSLKERFEIMVKYYGFVPTVVRHFGFSIRLAFGLLKNRSIY